jgi:Gas vesicle protein
MANETTVTRTSLAGLLESPDESLLDVVDSLLDQGVVLDGEIVLGLADVDLVYLRLSALLVAADRVLQGGSRKV